MQSSDARILRGAAIPSGLAGIAAVLAGLLLGGAKGALGAAIGVIVVLAFFSISVVAVSYASKISPQMMFAAAVFSYITKLLVMLVLVAVFQDATAWNPAAFAYTVIALTLVWIGAEIRTTLKTKTLYVDPAPSPGAEPATKADADRSP
ncbi:hypothetical protein [Actinomadura macrotermitis]|uniref:ATP synthase protein I n=1 Tax=Actinomadura macrotermitis TaxID=2585200 RepID=A0A7K0C213_9ACTN|nr:hypothetical protein [Actinomadura macrotermitis]MQY06834.1 hypothetical protein [Actinomadura macrotermitis]